MDPAPYGSKQKYRLPSVYPPQLTNHESQGCVPTITAHAAKKYLLMSVSGRRRRRPSNHTTPVSITRSVNDCAESRDSRRHCKLLARLQPSTELIHIAWVRQKLELSQPTTHAEIPFASFTARCPVKAVPLRVNMNGVHATR